MSSPYAGNRLGSISVLMAETFRNLSVYSLVLQKAGLRMEELGFIRVGTPPAALVVQQAEASRDLLLESFQPH